MEPGQRLRAEVPGESHHRELVSCQQACPVRTDARGYVRAIADGDFERAYLIARGPNPFASICGRICAAPCEAACRRGKIPRTDAGGFTTGIDLPISIRALKRFACERHGVEARGPRDAFDAVQDYVPEVAADAEELAVLLKARASGAVPLAGGEPVAIVGGGCAGLAAAHDLALLGFAPVVFESEPVPAGMLALGIPEYRLPRELIRREIAVIEALGAEIRCNQTVGRDVSFADLRRCFRAVIVAVGAKRPRALGLPGESGPGVYGGVDFLRAVALGESMPLGRDVVVIGGGNVAYDVARTVVRQMAYDAARTAARQPGMRRVRLVSLETLEEMPADTVEIREGDEEGVVRLGGLGPVEVVRDTHGRVQALRVRRCLRVYDPERRFAPVFDESDVSLLECDTVLVAAGQTTDLSFLDDGGADIVQFRPGWPQVEADTLASTAAGVFVAGDLAHGTRLVIDAVASGKRAARSVYRYVTGRTIAVDVPAVHLELERYRREPGYESTRRVPVPVCPPEDRMQDSRRLVEIGYDAAAARREASRCLDCGVTPVFDGTRCVLCGGCADVCPTGCLKLVALGDLEPTADLVAAATVAGCDLAEHSAILKDEERCIRCALCEARCPVDAITMERVRFTATWRAAS